jgi:membrane-associated phospholipid phosphatase
MRVPRFRSADVVLLGFLALLGLLAPLGRSRYPGWLDFVVLDAAILSGALLLLLAAGRWRSVALRVAADWYPVVVLLWVFHELSYLVQAVHPRDYDSYLIAADRWLFGADPAVAIRRFARPWLTDWMQICYISYYFQPLIVGIPLYLSGDGPRFERMRLGLVLSFSVSFLGYFAFPALGPRFTLEPLVGSPPEGSFVAGPLYRLLDHLERASHTRDAFPSAHIAVALVNQYYCFRFLPRLGWWLTPVIATLAVSTVYLGYHYIVDLLAGFVLGVACIAVVERPLRARAQ